MLVMATDQTAPAQLELVREFVNTLDVEDDIDTLATPAEALAWLRPTASNTVSARWTRRTASDWSRSARRCGGCCSPTTPASPAGGGDRAAQRAVGRGGGDPALRRATAADLVTHCGGVDSAIARLLVDRPRIDERPDLAAAQGVSGRGLSVGVLRPLAQPLGHLVRDRQVRNRAKARRFRERNRPASASLVCELRSDCGGTVTEQLWGGETAKAVENFPVSGQPVPPR